MEGIEYRVGPYRTAVEVRAGRNRFATGGLEGDGFQAHKSVGCPRKVY